VSWFPKKRWFPLGLNVIGLVLVALALWQRGPGGMPGGTAAAAWAAWGLWALVSVLPEWWTRARFVIYLLMLAGGAYVAAATDVAGFVPGIIAILVLAGTAAYPLRLIAGVAVLAVALLALGAEVAPVDGSTLVSSYSLLLICGLGGLSRRQHEATEEQSRALLEGRIAVEQERALVATLSERSRIARDLHDVLAHSLGGLVIQLEAVDALLESGRGPEAHQRVIAARKLAASGLAEAKEAVTALREPSDELSTVLADLVATHRALGGDVIVHGQPDRGGLTPQGRTALRRAVQELLTNGRRHAPGARTALTLDWGEEELTVTASTPAPPEGAARSRAGGGNGLAGMRERVTEAGGTMTVQAGPPFEVVLRLPRPGRTADKRHA
jgi:signal transduction histidine kinase